MPIVRPPNTTDEQFTTLLIDQCSEIYRTTMQEGISQVKESDQFYILHTNAMFSSLATFSENFNTILVHAKYLVALTQKLKSMYRSYTNQFHERRRKFESKCSKRLEDSLLEYNREMTKRCNGIIPEDLPTVHRCASDIALQHLSGINASETRHFKQIEQQLKTCMELRKEFYSVKIGIEVDLDDDWFGNLTNAIKAYDKEMSKKCSSGTGTDDLEKADEHATKQAEKILHPIEGKSKARYNYAKSLLEKSMGLIKNSLKRQCGLKIGSSISSSEVYIQTGKEGFLGRGGYGSVHRGFIKYLDVVAVKCQMLDGSKDTIEKNRDRFIKEVRLLNEANHSHIVRIEGYTSWCNSMAIVMEYLPGGNLHDLLLTKDDGSHRYDISPSIKLRFSADISSGITYLHNGFNDKRMVHGDLKPANILLTSDLRCKVGDFGGAEFATQTDDVSTSRPGVGERTKGFAAPERIAQPHAQLKKAMDVYSFGVIVYVIMARNYPEKDYDMFTNCLKSCCSDSGDQSDPIKKLLCERMMKCCDKNPDSRPLMIDVRNSLLQLSSSQDVAALTKEVANIQQKMPMKIPYLKVEECKRLMELNDRLNHSPP